MEELVLRKTTTQFIEKIFDFYDMHVNHDIFKKLVSNELATTNKLEFKIKRYYETYIFLLNNSKEDLNRELFNSFYYLLKQETPNESITNKIVTEYFYINDCSAIEKAIKLHNIIKQCLVFSDDLDKTIIPLMFINYELVKNNIPSIRFNQKDLEKYITLNKSEEYFIFLYDIITNYRHYPKNYFKEISLEDIYTTLKNDELLLKEKYNVKHLLIHGSFAKNDQKNDSDIDLLICFNDGQSFDTKTRYIDEIKIYYTNLFKRFVDIEEVSYFICDEVINKIKRIVKVF